MSIKDLKPLRCACGAYLTEEEIKYYGTSCENCERKWMEDLANEGKSECPSAETLLCAIAKLFDNSRECFGLDEPEELEAQEDFEEALAKLLCEGVGHMELQPDQCGKPEHDYCGRCRTRRENIGT